jgi:hypothetical protein
VRLKEYFDQIPEEENQSLVFQEYNNETSRGVLESMEMNVDSLLFSKGDWIEEDECRDEDRHFQVIVDYGFIKF